jgi:HK97 family phage prohead protease
MPQALKRRTFAGDHDLDHPVDALGRVRWRAQLNRSDIEQRPEGGHRFRGHASVFNSRTWIGARDWGFWEQIAPSAFNKTIAEADVRFLVNHDPNLLLARNKSGTLRLSVDDVGLVADADMAPVSYADDVAVLLSRGDLSQMSFAFEPIAWVHEAASDGKDMFTITEARLWDVSVVTYPAYEDTDAGLRSHAFEVLARSLGADPSDLLAQVADGADLIDLAAFRSDDDPRPPAESTGDTEDHDPPAESTGTESTHIRSLRRLELATQSINRRG